MTYSVRWAFTVDSDEPGFAVLDTIDMFVEKGLRNWIFRVDDTTTKEIVGYFDGYGNPVNIDEFNTDMETEAAAAPESENPEPQVAARHALPEPSEPTE